MPHHNVKVWLLSNTPDVSDTATTYDIDMNSSARVTLSKESSNIQVTTKNC